MACRTSTETPPRPYRFSINLPDMMADTVHLSPEAFGCYQRLLHAHWRSGPTKDDNLVLARIVGLPPKDWTTIRPEVEPFFDIQHGVWSHWRLEEDLEAAYSAIKKNKDRTRAATEARKARGKINRYEHRNDDRNEQRDGDREPARNVVLTGSTQQRPLAKGADDDFRGGDDVVPPGWIGDLRAAEDSFLAGVAGPVVATECTGGEA